jgi:hypothetical protein
VDFFSFLAALLQTAMKSDDIRKLVLSKPGKGKMPIDVFCEMEGAVSLRTIKYWKRMRGQGGDVIGRRYEQPPTAATRQNVMKVESPMRKK